MSDTELQDAALQVDTEKGNFSYPEDYAYDAGNGTERRDDQLYLQG